MGKKITDKVTWVGKNFTVTNIPSIRVRPID